MKHKDFAELAAMPWYLWILLGSLLLTQSIWIYKDAEKRGENKWLWGLYGLTNVPTSGFVYWFVTRKIWRRFKRNKAQ